MRFVKFLIGGALILGSIILFFAILFVGVPSIMFGGSWANFVFWGVIDFVAFMGGIYLVRHR